jgi:hypothetical protein
VSTTDTERERLLQQLADLLDHDDERVTQSTIMGFPCLRIDGKFFACVERATGNLIVKLPAERVNDLVRTGSGRPFAPNGRVFKEWVACPAPARELWTDLLNEAKRYVDGVQPRYAGKGVIGTLSAGGSTLSAEGDHAAGRDDVAAIGAKRARRSS